MNFESLDTDFHDLDQDRWARDLISSFKIQSKKPEINHLGWALVFYCHAIAWLILGMGLI